MLHLVLENVAGIWQVLVGTQVQFYSLSASAIFWANQDLSKV